MNGKPTKDQWNQVEKQLDQLYTRVYLRCDGYLISAALQRVGKNKLAIAMDVDGYVRGEWIVFLREGEEMPEVPRRFCCPRTRGRYPPAFVRAMEKAIGKRRCKAEGYYERRVSTFPGWSRPRPFIRHLIKHNDSIEILDNATYARELEAKEVKP